MVRAGLRSIPRPAPIRTPAHEGAVNPQVSESPQDGVDQYQPTDCEWPHAPHGVPYTDAM
ncbi:hypothetical protein Slu03_30110 [Sediminihabitans luteus]|nr:hypothetical protein Slu03_30110 [Sediminihabitans luteus]